MPVTPMRGFTLVEMAIVLMIVAFLLGGLLGPLSAQLENQRISETDRLLSEVRDALIGFALSRGRLPCPADPERSTSSSGAGTENRSSGACVAANGVVPWADLGVRETDAWGRRLTYRVTLTFADDPPSTLSGCDTSSTVSFQLCSDGNLTVKSAASSGSDIGINVPAVVVSHGPNGFGAYQPSGGSKLPVGSNSDEQENSDADQDFVSHGRTPTFDDQVIWLSRQVLFNRMVTAGKLP